MKKISKILLAPITTVVAIPTTLFATSCNNIDYAKVEEWFTTEYAAARTAFEALPDIDETLKKAIAQVGDLELCFIHNKVPFYQNQMMVNLRKEKYHLKDEMNEYDKDLEIKKWDIYLGSAGDERKNYYLPYKQAMVDAGKWVTAVGDDNDATFTTFGEDEEHNKHKVNFYQTMAVFNGGVSGKGYKLKDVCGWAVHLIWATSDVKYGKNPKEHYYKDPDLFADVDGANLSYIYDHMETTYKSPTLTLYKYYTDLKSNKSRFDFFFKNTLNFEEDWDDEKRIDAISARVVKNYYLIQYMTEFTDLAVGKNAKEFVTATRGWLNRISQFYE